MKEISEYFALMTESINKINNMNLIKYFQREVDLDFMEDEDSD